MRLPAPAGTATYGQDLIRSETLIDHGKVAWDMSLDELLPVSMPLSDDRPRSQTVGIKTLSRL